MLKVWINKKKKKQFTVGLPVLIRQIVHDVEGNFFFTLICDGQNTVYCTYIENLLFKKSTFVL